MLLLLHKQQEFKHPGYIPDRDNADEVKRLREARTFDMYLPFVKLKGIPAGFHDPYLEFLERFYDQHSKTELECIERVWETASCRVWGVGSVLGDARSILDSVTFPSPVSLKLKTSGFLGNTFHIWTEVSSANGVNIVTDPGGTGKYPLWKHKDRELFQPHFGLKETAPETGIETYNSGKTIPTFMRGILVYW